MAAKVATDLKRLQRFYGSPSDAMIVNYEAEVTELLKGGYLGEISYGFRRDNKWIEPTLKYTARDLASTSANDDDPGRIRPGSDISGASFGSFLSYNSAWSNISSTEREAIGNRLPFKRGDGAEPGVNGYLINDVTYSSGGRALNRAIVKSY